MAPVSRARGEREHPAQRMPHVENAPLPPAGRREAGYGNPEEVNPRSTRLLRWDLCWSAGSSWGFAPHPVKENPLASVHRFIEYPSATNGCLLASQFPPDNCSLKSPLPRREV